VIAMLGVLGLGVCGYLAAGWSLGDAIYMIVITLSTVGFTEVRPISGAWLRLHTTLVIVFGYIAVSYTLAGLVALLTEEELRRYLGTQRVKRQIEALRDHVIVVGLGRMGTQVCAELESRGTPFVVIDRDAETIEALERRGWICIQGDATEEKVLLDAGLRTARALVAAIPDDAVNVFITLTAREQAPRVQILARAEHQSTQHKLERAGASHVVLPAAIGAQRIVAMITNPSAVSFAELVSQRFTLEIEMDEVEVSRGGDFSGKTLRDLDIQRRTGVIVIAIKHVDGSIDFPPTGSEALLPGDRLVLLGGRAKLGEFRAVYSA
jgi:voltage-gated potassium channel